MHVLTDLRFAFRSLLRNPRFTITATLTAGMAIGASTVVFSAVNGILLKPLDLPEPERAVYVSTHESAGVTSKPIFIDWNRQVTAFELLAGFGPDSLVIANDEQAEQISAVRVSPDVVELLDAQFILGGPFAADDHETGAEPVVILSYSYWIRAMAAATDVIDKAIFAANDEGGRQPYRIAGVLAEDVTLPAATNLGERDIWLPLHVDETARAGNRGSSTTRVIDRVAEGRSIAEARIEVERVTEAISSEHGREDSAHVVRLLDRTVGGSRAALWMLLAASGFLLLVAQANVANLLLAQATTRGAEFAVRSALGAGQGRVLGQVLTESVVLGSVSGVLGGSIAYGGAWLEERRRASTSDQGS